VLPVAEEVTGWLRERCGRVQVVGSVRRERPRVYDLDILVLTSNPAGLADHLTSLSFAELLHIRELHSSHTRCVHCESAIPVDIYVVTAMADWWPMLVMTTGSKRHIKALRNHGRDRLYKIGNCGHLVNLKGQTKVVRSERGYYQALKHPYCHPRERN